MAPLKTEGNAVEEGGARNAAGKLTRVAEDKQIMRVKRK